MQFLVLRLHHTRRTVVLSPCQPSADPPDDDRPPTVVFATLGFAGRHAFTAACLLSCLREYLNIQCKCPCRQVSVLQLESVERVGYGHTGAVVCHSLASGRACKAHPVVREYSLDA